MNALWAFTAPYQGDFKRKCVHSKYLSNPRYRHYGTEQVNDTSDIRLLMDSQPCRVRSGCCESC